MAESQTEKKRSRFLSVWLIFLPIFNSGITIIPIFLMFADEWVPVTVISAALNIVFSCAAWKWKKWGVWGLGAMSVVAAILCSITHFFIDFLFIPIDWLGGTVGAVVLAILVRRVWNQFEWR
jgi:hypothetical protein